MRQPSLFDPPVEKPEDREVNVDVIRKHLRGTLWLLRQAETVPWRPQTAKWKEDDFTRLLRHMPPEEGEAMLAEFKREMERLRKAAAA